MYNNAPLVEVIAEIKWRLIPIKTVPNGGVDPHFEALETKLLPHLMEQGYNDVQRLIPREVPEEMLAHSAIYRCRTAKNKWPLIQFGPGVVSANVVPPYEGWESFWPVVQQAVWSTFSDAIHGANKPSIESIVVRYIDAFNATHGAHTPQSFMAEHLNLDIGLPSHIIDGFTADAPGNSVGMHQSFPITRPSGATCFLRCNSGAVNGEPSVILDTQIKSQVGVTWDSEAQVASWIHDAKHSLKDLFEAMISSDLREKMEPKA